ncbi:MAG: Hsp20/alpha crystallin family protein [Bacillota bacterium]
MENRNLPALLNKYCHGDRCFSFLHMLENLLMGANSWNPTIKLQEDGDELILSADIPGFEPQDLDITVRGNIIILQGDTRREEIRDQPGYYCAARSYHSFYRTVPLPVGIKPEQTVIHCNNGELELKMVKGRSLVRSYKPLEVSVDP